MSEEIIKLDGINGVQVLTPHHRIREKHLRLDYARKIKDVNDGVESQNALATAEHLEFLIDTSRRSANNSKTHLLHLIREIEDAHLTFTRDLENEMHRLRNLSGAYNAAKEQAERKDNVV